MINNKDLAAIRKDYTLRTFNESQVLTDPVEQFRLWLNEAIEADVNEPNAMTLATVYENGNPSARIVLLKGLNENGFVFYTNYNSNKGKQIQHNPNAALVFFWPELQRQVRIEGVINKGSKKDATAYFQSRPIESRIGAHASRQSEVIKSREELENSYNTLKTLFEKEPLLCPVDWGGFVLKPCSMEFWQGRASRLHDRILFTLHDKKWLIERLAP